MTWYLLCRYQIPTVGIRYLHITIWRYLSLYVCIVKWHGRYDKVFFLKYLHILRSYLLVGIKYLHQVFCQKYLLLYLSLSACILLKVTTHTYCCMRRFRHRFLRGRFAVCSVASPSHRRIASAPHRVAAVAWRLANFIRITIASGAADSLHADWRSGATAAGSRRSDDEDTSRSSGRNFVTRWSSRSYARFAPSDEEYRVEALHSTIHSKT